MEEVLLTEDLGEEGIIPKVLFPQLELLILKDLPVLKRFCVGSNIKFPSLKDMEIEKCPKLESFIFKPVSSGMTLSKELKEVNSEEISQTAMRSPQTAMQPLFNEEVAFPNLESLLISHMPNLEIIWHDKFAPGSYTKLQSMNVQFCESLMNIFQVNMLSRFQSLESLVVDDCGSLQEIFELEGQEVTETRAVTVTQLKKLFMHRLPKLKRVWNKEPQEMFSFPNLQKISVWKCESLKSLFPTAVARCLKQLDDLRIVECGIEEIIEQEEGAKEDARFVFPKLTLLFLRELSKLKWFYRGVHTLEWPLLKTLEVSRSNEIQIFALKNYRTQEQDEQSQLETSVQQPLFLVEEVAFPSLEKLCLLQCMLEDIAMIGELRNLEILTLLHPNVEQLPREIGLLTRLRILNVNNCTKLKVIPPNVLSCLIQLEELYVGNSFTQWDVEGLNNERASLTELKHLSRLTTLEVHIPDANMLPKDLLFEKLQRYKIFVGDVWDWSDKHENSRALKLKLNTSFHLEKGIKMLLNGIENLCLDELKGVKSVIYELDMTGFQQLKHLHVQNNVEIKYIINSRGMDISNVIFPVLEILSLKNMINLEEICHGQIPSASFSNLSIMKVEHCQKLKFIFSSTIAKGLPQLQELAIQECSIMGAIIIKEEGEIEDRDMILFPQLRHVKLHQLPKLVSFLNTQKSVINDAGEIIPECELNFHMPILQEQVVFPNLEKLELSCIDSEEILLQNQHWASSSFKLTIIQTDSRFQNLCELKVTGSGNLKYLLSSSTARSMVQLKFLDIEKCKVMEEIILIEDLGQERTSPMVFFPQLEYLFLKDLPVLKRFSVGSNVRFPYLKSLQIEQCPKLESFIFKPVSSSMTLSKELKETNSEEISHTAMQPLFNEEVAFPNLESLIIFHMPNLKIIWHDKFALTKLKSMKVQFCESLMNIFQVNMLSRFQRLESLVVDDCGSLQEIFELEGQEVTETRAVRVTQLKKLFMHRLPKLKRVWNKDPQGTFSFPNLQQIEVGECESLKSLFPTSVARCLKQLDNLRIVECGIEEIIEQEQGAKEDARFVFPKLTLLILQQLLKLKWFYRGVHTLEWPLLKTLEVSGSNEIQIFASKNYRIQEQDEQSQQETSIQQPLFLVEEVAFPSLETLCLDLCVLEDIAMIGEMRNLEILRLLHSNVKQLPRETGLLTHLRILDLRNCTELKVIPPNVLSCLIKLEELYVVNSFTQWDVEGLNNERASLAELKHLSRLTTLEVHIPDANMLPKDLSFEKLQRYKIFVGDVRDWSGENFYLGWYLKMLLNYLKNLCLGKAFESKIYALVNSRELKLKLNTSFHLERGIKMLLNGVENLSLDELKGVKSVICELDMTGFQQLKRFHVQNNVEIKYIINSRGMVISDVVFPVLEVLSLKNMINLEEICHGQIPSASFRNLSIMKVEHCEKLKFIFSSTIAKGLPQLQELVIQECNIMGAIIIKEEGEIEDRDMILFPQLRHLELRQLPKLVSFLNARKSIINDAGEIIPECELDFHMPILQEQGTLFPNLEVLRLGGDYKMKEIQCDQLFEECLYKLKVLHVIDYVAVSDWITFLKRLHSLEKLFVNSSSWEEIFSYKELFDMETHATILPKLRELELSKLPMLTHLWKEDTQPSPMFHNLEKLKVLICDKLKNLVPSSVSFQNLTNLKICKCRGLINLVTSSTAKSLVQLKKMSVSECERMTEVVTGEGGEVSEVITFTQLTCLKLDCLPNLSSFCSRSYSFEFPSLEKVIVRQCPEMKTFSHGALGTPKLERVQATQEDEWHWKANLNTTIHWLWESKYNTTTQ